MDILQRYWIEKYVGYGLNARQIKDVLKLSISLSAFRKWLNRNGFKTDRTKRDEYKNLVLDRNL